MPSKQVIFIKKLKISFLQKIPLPLQRHIAKIINFNFFSMYSGTVKFFNETKGFGFIVDNNSGEEIFVHISGLIDNIREGDKVTYQTERGKKGMNAVDVKIA